MKTTALDAPTAPLPPTPPGPPAGSPAASAHKPLMQALWQAVCRHRWRTLAALVLLILAKLASVCVPLLLKAVIDRFSRPEEMAATVSPGVAAAMPEGGQLVVLPVFLLLGYALLRFSSTVFTELRDMCFSRVTLRAVADLAERALSHLHRMGPRFHVQRHTGALIRDVDRGTAGVGFLLGAMLFTLLPTLVEIGAVLAIMAVGYGPWFVAIILHTFLVYASYTGYMTRRRMAVQRSVNVLDSRANGQLVDSLLNYEAVRVHARESHELDRYASLRRAWVERSVDNQKALSALHVGQGAIIAAGVGAIMLLAGQETIRGIMTVGDLVLVNSYVLQICMPLNALGFMFRQAKDAMIDAEKLVQLIEEPAEVSDAPRAVPLEVKRGEVSFEHVDFSYEQGRQILWDVSFSIAPGQTLAVVGGSGSGKSTLARLLTRLYDTANGHITIDGVDLKEVTLASLRAAVGIVPQDTVLFNETIAYNIAYGRAGASMGEVVEAARAAQLDEFIAALPEQYDTIVGERGLKLSGGEKQRISIARAFLKNPPILIFDEATSALDTRAERAIQAQLDRIALGRTTLIIAHRLSTIVGADQIIVLDHGRIVERGRHQELLLQGGLYSQLWGLQRQQQEFDRLERQLARQPLNLAVLLANVVDGLRASTEGRGVYMYTMVDIDNARITGDPSELTQVMWDLCSHALEATPPGGRIELRLERSGVCVRLSVTDGRHVRDGRELPPLPQDERKLAMDPLALRSSVERQGGRFSIEPPSSVHGMRFVVELPLRAVGGEARLSGTDVAETAAELPREAEGPRLADLRVMVIDDQAEARESLTQLMDLEGARTLPFDSGSAALAWLERHPVSQWPQVLICDIALGDEDGHVVIRCIRQLEEKRGLALDRRMSAVALTGFAQPADRIRALMSGFQVHMAKPVDPDELISMVQGLGGRGPGAAGGSAARAVSPTH